MKNICTLVLLMIMHSGFSQTDSINLYNINHFTVSLKDGLIKSKFTPSYGTETIEERFGHIYQLQFNYTFNFKANFGLALRSNFGISAFTYDLASKDGFNGTEGWTRFYRDSYNAFAKIGAGIHYHKQIKPSLLMHINLGLGASTNSNGHHSRTSSTYLNPEGTLQNQNYNINYSYTDDIIGYGFMDLGINYVLKNKNLIGLSLSPELFFKPNLTGNYSIYNSTSGGTISNTNHNISLSLNYTFTQYQKYRKNQFMIQTTFLSKKERKKAYKKEKRFVDPNSIFISGGSGLFSGRNIVKDPGNRLYSNAFQSWSVFVNLEKGIKKQFYYSFGLEVSEYWSSIKYTPYSSSGSNLFIATKLNFGLSKRFVSTQTNRNYINLYAGASLSFQPNKKGLTSWGGGQMNSSTDYFAYQEQTSITSLIFPTLYLAIEKDLHLTKNLYFSIKYKYDQGFFNAAKTDIQYQTAYNGTITNATSKINGTAHTVSFGFKYKFLQKK